MNGPEASDPAGIELSLRLTYPGFDFQIELTLPSRGVTALFGSSGCGKTTCLRLIAGLERGHGQVRVLGELWQDEARGLFLPPHRRGVGYVFQEPSLFSHLDVRQNLAYALKRRRQTRPGFDFDSVVDLLEIRELLSRSPERLSGGERQRVAIARALLAGPRLLLMDEPLAALDATRKADILPQLERLRDELSIPIVYVSHILDEVARLADLVVLMDRGRALAVGPLGPILTRLDLPVSRGEEAGAVLEGVLGFHDDRDHLSRLDFDGGPLWVGRSSRAIGTRARVRILARDVSLALEAPGHSSILNVLPVRVLEISADREQVMVRLALNSETWLLARISHRSLTQLGLGVGVRLFAQIKSAAVTV